VSSAPLPLHCHGRFTPSTSHNALDLVERIERATGLRRDPDRCMIYGPQDRRTRPMDPAFIDHMIDHVDWSAEALIGYKRPELRSNEI
jgi:hypothetical protein